MLVKVLNSNRQPKDDNIELYVQDRTIDAIIGCTGKNVYEDYIEFCNQNELPVSLNNDQFRSRLCRHYDLTTTVAKIDGHSIRVIVKK